METISLIFACATVILAIYYVRKIKKQLNNVEKAFKEACLEIHKLKAEQDNPIEIEYRADGRTAVKRILSAE